MKSFLLGQAYLSLSEGDRETHVKEAVKCFRETLKSVDREQQPQLHTLASSVLHRAWQGLTQNPPDTVELPCSAVTGSRATDDSEPEGRKVEGGHNHSKQETQP